MPNNLVVKGTDLNPSGASPVGLGDVNVTIGGDVRATKKPGDQLRLIGTVNTVRGTYDFQGRRFDIQRDGRIQFGGSSEIDPRLDIVAQRIISGVEAQVHVRGTARKPELTLTSRPPLDEADILSLIIFNQPANALGEGQQVSLAQRAGALASGFVASSLARSIGGALELDVFEIQAAPEDGSGPSVTLGEQVGERLFLKFRQAFGAQSVSEFILDNQLSEVPAPPDLGCAGGRHDPAYAHPACRAGGHRSDLLLLVLITEGWRLAAGGGGSRLEGGSRLKPLCFRYAGDCGTSRRLQPRASRQPPAASPARSLSPRRARR